MITLHSNSAGFTLIEVLMAMLIMTVGLLGLLQSVNVAYEHNSRNRLRDEAMQVGEEQMNVFRSRVNSTPAFTPVTTVPRGIGGVTRSFTVTRQSDATGEHSKRLRVAIGWTFKGVSTGHVIYSMKSE